MSNELSQSADVRTLTEWIDESERITVLTGAGISTDSGIPDFRGPNGVWTKNPKAEKASNIQNFIADPEVRKASWRDRLDNRAWSADPNDGHRALVQLEKRNKLVALLTQNVDGLHIRAGSPTTSLYEIHGNIGYMRALKAGHDTKERTLVPNIFYETSISIKEALASTIFASTGTPSHRPNVLWFDEFYDEKIYRSQSAVNFASMSDLLIIAGTSGATSLPQQLFQIAQRNGIPILEINPCPSHFTKGLQRNPANRYWPIDASRAFSFIEEILTPNRK